MKLGTYHYKHAHGGRDMFGGLALTSYKARVEILSETRAQYSIRLMEYHADGRPPNTVLNVRKKNVTLDDAPVQPLRDDIRLPYKD